MQFFRLFPALAAALTVSGVLAWLPVAAVAQDSGRLALLIANGAYRDANLPMEAPAKDATLLAGELGRDGFSTDLKKDLGKQDMQAAIDSFFGKIRPGTSALFYYSGIGIQAAHQTYLVPVNAEIWSEEDVKREGVSLDAVVAEMGRRGAKVKIVIIDAARRNPFERRFRAYSAGLASIDAPEDTLVLYSVAPNKVGKDRNNAVSLFMNELVKELRTPDISAEQAMTYTRIGVSKASNGEEVPWVASSLVDPFFFGKGGAPAGPAPSPAPAVTAPTPAPMPAPKPASPAPKPPPHVADATPPKPAKPPAPMPAPTPPAAPPQHAEVAKPPPPTSTSSAAQTGAPADLKPGVAFRDCANCPEVVVLAGGAFQMGAGTTPFDRPAHQVTLAKPFAMGRTEVTFAEWGQCVTEGGCTYRPDSQGFGGGDHPVINVSWFDAKDYLAWLSRKTGKTYRLPSEAEWEYAAHGGTTTIYAWGGAMAPKQANCADCGEAGAARQTDAVKSFPPNGFGLYDMAGNAAEWVEDCWNLTYRGAPKDGSAWQSGSCGQRVLRGGSFDSSSAYVKPAARFRYDADVRYWANGFRVVREVK